MERLQQVKQSLKSPLEKSADDVVICCSVRTPLTKAKRGLMKDTSAEVMLQTVFEAIADRTKIDKKNIQDIVVGNVLQPGAGENQSRMGMFLAGYPETTTVTTVNRFCSSGLEAISVIASKIKAGYIDIGIGSGVEQMSMYDMQKSVDPEKISETVFEHPQAQKCLMPMGITSENVAEKFNISREVQDKFAVESHTKALMAQKQGLFNDEIVKVKTIVRDKDGNEKEVTVTQDDGCRPTTFEGLSKLKPAFKKGGSTTAGNSSQVTEGAAATLLARRSYAEKMGLPILAKFVGYTVQGCPPEIMGIGPYVAIPQVLKQVGLQIDQIGVWEINEAFATQASFCVKELKIDPNRVNPKGGAIALGHPLGCTGARQMATLLPELKRQKQKYGVVSMCIGSGMGAACVIENEQN